MLGEGFVAGIKGVKLLSVGSKSQRAVFGNDESRRLD